MKIKYKTNNKSRLSCPLNWKSCNNPLLRYVGYCLQKNNKELQLNYEDFPNKIIRAIVDANIIRKYHIGIYRLTIKINLNSFRDSAI